MVANTRLRESDRQGAINALHGVLNNVVRFWEMPVRDRFKWAKAWNSKFPPELFKAMDVCRELGYAPIAYKATSLWFAVEQEGKFYSAKINFDWLPPTTENYKAPMRMTSQVCSGQPWHLDVCAKSVDGSDTVYQGVHLSLADLHEHLGASDTELFMDWIVTTSNLRSELLEAHQTIKDIFEMAKTAGQIKRMVPDLLQYLSAEMRNAYSSQVRASSLPFEWAPYPRDRVERMITALGKGHLLAGMAKANQSGWEVSQLDDVIWGMEVQVKDGND